MAINQISISKIFSLATEPSNAVVDRFWFDTTNNELKRYDGTSWVPIKVNADDVKAVYPDNTTTTLSDYLSTLTSAIGDLNTNKQDKLPSITDYGPDNGITINSYNITNNCGVLNLKATQEVIISSTTAGDDSNSKLTLNIPITGNYVDTDILAVSANSSGHIPSTTAVITELNKKQDTTDTTLNTTDKTIVGAINEIKDVNDSQATSITNLNNKTSIITEVNEGEGLVSQNIAGDLRVNYGAVNGGGNIYVKSLVANKAVVATSGGKLISASATSTEIDYLTGTTSNIQTQINSLQTQLNLDHPTNTISAFVIAPSSNTIGVSITDGSGTAAAGKGGKIIVSPTGTNVGAVYVTTESTKPTALPLYPNTVVEFGPYANLSDVLVYVDSLGDSVSVQISHV